MNPNTGELFYLTQKQMTAMSDARRDNLNTILSAQQNQKFIELSESEFEELEPLDPPQRKNKMRNKPCRCGSGIKFKRCCWSKYL